MCQCGADSSGAAGVFDDLALGTNLKCLYSTWVCDGPAPQTFGTFNRTGDCTFSQEIELTGALSIAGRETLTVLTAKSGKRHFKVGTHALTLKWFELTGGFSNPPYNGADHLGGSAFVGSGGYLHALSCWFHSNNAYNGGSIYATHSGTGGHTTITLVNTTVTDNTASNSGGGIYIDQEGSSLVVDGGGLPLT